jgi:hypothetical protein
VIFATPDFGASGGIVCFLMLVWAVVLTLVVAGIIWGRKLHRSESPTIRKVGLLLVLVSVLVPFGCCFGPPHVVRIIYGNYPLKSYPNGKIKEGMTPDEVVAILGNPHERHKQSDGEHWYYWLDSFDISYFGVYFGPDGRVTGTHGN